MMRSGDERPVYGAILPRVGLMPAERNPTLIPLPIILFARCRRPLSCRGREVYKNSKWPLQIPLSEKRSWAQGGAGSILGYGYVLHSSPPSGRL